VCRPPISVQAVDEVGRFETGGVAPPPTERGQARATPGVAPSWYTILRGGKGPKTGNWAGPAAFPCTERVRRASRAVVGGGCREGKRGAVNVKRPAPYLVGERFTFG